MTWKYLLVHVFYVHANTEFKPNLIDIHMRSLTDQFLFDNTADCDDYIRNKVYSSNTVSLRIERIQVKNPNG